MFTGIVEAMGTVVAAADAGGRRRFTIDAGGLAAGLRVGDSMAVNGVCLTAVEVAGAQVAVEAVDETLARSNLGRLQPGSPVNLERPMRADARFDGHIVQGHVDGVGTVRSITHEGASIRLWIDAPAPLRRYLVEKGSVAVDGVSLTVSAVDDAGFEVVLIPHTLGVTLFGTRGPGDAVNLEADVIAKYVERLLEGGR
ncbi:MAG: riboflavin synthase [Acidimicrobiia bacterium]|jgi:riboflavin synthase|nr:riboflavin synthase [Acidimicrobiia bacterium]